MTQQILTVSEITLHIQALLEEGFAIVQISGEISNYKHHSSGHRYFTLKDARSQIKCVFWKSRTMSMQITEGMRVVITGKISVYPAQGTYQIDCFSVTPFGIGDLFIAFEQLKNDLLQKGYFSSDRKKSLPTLPLHVGVATSATGAVLHDICSTLERRFPLITLYLRPTIVQGEASSKDIVKAIQDLHSFPCDVIILARGGGSIEDLWSFNTIEVAEAIYSATIPIISAIGHETDVTIADYVADVRAATPTAAAELCSPYRQEDLMYSIDRLQSDIEDSLRHKLDSYSTTVQSYVEQTGKYYVSSTIQSTKHIVETCSRDCMQIVQNTLRMYQSTLTTHHQVLQQLNPFKPLDRGFALLKDQSNSYIHHSQQLLPNQIITIERKNSSQVAVIES